MLVAKGKIVRMQRVHYWECEKMRGHETDV